MEKKKTTMEDIAKQLNISKVSVYKALSNKSDISDDLKAKVNAKAIELRYKSVDPLTKLCKHYFYILPRQFVTSTEQFYFGIYKELSKILSEKGATLDIHIADDDFSIADFEKTVKTYRYNATHQIGYFWAGVITYQMIEAFAQLALPLICIDSHLSRSKGSFIYIDDYHAGYEITEYLIQKGHRDICFVIDVSSSNNLDKLYGFQKGLKTYNIPFRDEMHIGLSLANMENLKHFVLPKPLPTAFLFDSDYSAQNFIITAINQGYQIPEDFSVACFDNTPLCEETIPRLTSIGVSSYEIAETAYRMMLKRLKTTNLRPIMSVLHSPIAERDSVLDISNKAK